MEIYSGNSFAFMDTVLPDIQHESDTTEPQAYGYSNANENAQYNPGTYETKDVIYWDGQDCMNWATCICYAYDIDPANVNINYFANITGETLMNHSQYEFYSIDSTHGITFYKEFRHILESRGIAPSSLLSTSNWETMPESHNQPVDDYQLTDLTMEMSIDIESIEGIESFEQLLNDPSQEFGEQFSDEPFVIKKESDNEYEDSYSYPYDNRPHEVPSSPVCEATTPPLSPELSETFVGDNDVLEKIKTTSRKRMRGPKNWEFLMRILANPTYNPTYIRWEDEDDFTFRITQPAAVAQIWGRRSSKPNLTYDNFARGLRYHYTTGALEAVSERQLVYKCGPKAKKYLRDMKKNGH